nr:integrase arm-type DNA-binding domain-containing protein [Solidesulfovibrio sp.]
MSPKGGKWWRLRYWISGRERLISLGTYPDISLKDARERRDEARKLIANGIDPGKARQDEKAAAEAQAAEDANTFEVVARDWHAKQVKAWSEGHAAKVLARMEQHLFPAFGHLPITTLRAPAILPTLREIEAKGHNETASLTDLWKAAGGTQGKSSKYWRELESTQEFVKTLSKKERVGKSDLFKAVMGRTGGTYAHWQIALATPSGCLYLDERTGIVQR